MDEATELRDEQDEFVHTKYGWCYYTLATPPIVYNLFVHPEYRGSGKAKRLLKMAVFEMISGGHPAGDAIQIEAIPTEPGIERTRLVRFYESLGLTVLPFRTIGGDHG